MGVNLPIGMVSRDPEGIAFLVVGKKLMIYLKP
jgi:hypothetical protein